MVSISPSSNIPVLCPKGDHGVLPSTLFTVYYSPSCSYYTLPNLSDLEHR